MLLKCLVFLLVLLSPDLFAQDIKWVSRAQQVDSNYIETFDPYLTGRFYFSQKYTSIVLDGEKKIADLRYRPNTTVNMGVGVTYRSLTINLAYGFPFLNRDKEKGTTKWLDLQSHVYTRNWSIDVFGQFYKGYFLFPKGLGNNDLNNFYVRPDLGISLFGLAVYNLRNGDRFSYRAAMLQSEWQKKSSGTWLVGGEVYAGSISADSALVPSLLENSYKQHDVSRIRFVELGPGAGYAYTLVLARHFFLTGAATANANFGLSREFSAEGTRDKLSFSPNFIYRGVLGYNSRKRNMNISVVGNSISVRGASSKEDYRFNTGNYRLTVVKRFLPGPKLKRKIKWLDPKPRL